MATGSYFVGMRAVGIKELKNHLSEYVRVAGTGETVLVTDRDRVVAELGPPSPGRPTALADAALAEAVRRGWITPPLGGRSGVPVRGPVAALAVLLAELDGDRGDR